MSNSTGNDQKPNPAKTNHKISGLRPRDAASLIIIDRNRPEPSILMGRRNSDLVFMPGKFVFPGGRTDPADANTKAFSGLRAQDENRLLTGMGSRASRRRAHALAITAIRETFEETGILIAAHHQEQQVTLNQTNYTISNDSLDEIASTRNPAPSSLLPDLSPLRYVARAITPPGFVRRYDARFFVCFLDEINDYKAALHSVGNTGLNNSPLDHMLISPAFSAPKSNDYAEPELLDLDFFSMKAAMELNIAEITRLILQDVQNLLHDDSTLSAHHSITQYRQRHGRHVREVI